MATATESPIKQSGGRDRHGEYRRETWLVVEATNLNDALLATNLPKFNDAWEYGVQFLASEVTAEPLQQASHEWHVHITYRQGFDWRAQNARPTQDTTKRVAKFWRVPSATPYGLIPPSDFSAPDASDIGGMPHDLGGEPQDFDVLQVSISLTFHRADPLIAQYASAVGKRNSDQFYEYEPQTLLFLGARIEPTSAEEERVTLRMLYDNLGHLTQRAQDIAEGRPRLYQLDIDGPDPKFSGKAFPVQWVQPYPQQTAFGALVI